MRSSAKHKPGPRDSADQLPRIQAPGPLAAIALVAALTVLGALGGWASGQRASLAQARMDTERHANMLAVKARGLLERYELFPAIAQFCPCVRDLLRDPGDPGLVDTANRRLEDIALRIRASATYLLDLDGVTLAASNWSSPGSFVGKNYALRPYFRDALTDGIGRMIAIGMTSQELGYYLAAPVDDAGRHTGVIVVKLSVAELQSWLERERDLHGLLGLYTDPYGVVFASSIPEFLFSAVSPLLPEDRRILELARSYAGEPLPPLGLTSVRDLGAGVRLIRFPDPRTVGLPRPGPYLEQAVDLSAKGWGLRALVPLADYAGVRASHAAVGLSLGLLGGLVLLLFLQREAYHRGLLAAARRDPLTGLATRLDMNNRLPRLVSAHARDPAMAFSLIMLDLDHFKQVNDKYGHPAGDRLLERVGAIVRENAGQDDLCVRMGGEELAVFHRSPDADAALEIAEHIRRRVQYLSLDHGSGEFGVTISAGVALHQRRESAARLIQRADRALYAAKHHGRNRVELAEAN